MFDLKCSIQDFKSQDQGERGDEHKKYYNTWAVSFKARWGAYSKKLLKELEKLYHGHPLGMTKGCRQSNQPLSCRVKRQWFFQWMKGYFWNLDPTAREVPPAAAPAAAAGGAQ